MKFMFDQFFGRFFHAPGTTANGMSLPELASASTIYGFGFLLLFIMFALLYARAYAKRAELKLSPLEIFDTKMFAGHHLVSAGVGLVAVLVALFAPGQLVFLSPMTFGLMGPSHWIFGTRADRRRKPLIGRLEGSA
ncbi:MAG: hypothetical protein ABIS06_22255 [Vicinamibacterales bacterium]